MQPPATDVDKLAGRRELARGLRVRVRFEHQTHDRRGNDHGRRGEHECAPAAEYPAGHPGLVALPLLTVGAREPAFFSRHHANVKGDGQDDGVERDRPGAVPDGPAEQNRQDREIYGIP